MRQVIKTGLPQTHSAFHLASVSQQSRTSPSMSSQLHVKASHARKHPVREAERLLLHPLLSPGPVSPGGVPLRPTRLGLYAGTRGPQPRPLAMPGWEKRPGRSLAPWQPAQPHWLGTDRRRDKNGHGATLACSCVYCQGPPAPAPRGSPRGVPQGPHIMKETKGNWGPERVWPHLVPQPRCGWVGDTKRGDHRRREEKKPSWDPISRSPPSAYGNMSWLLVTEGKTEAQGAQS